MKTCSTCRHFSINVENGDGIGLSAIELVTDCKLRDIKHRFEWHLDVRDLLTLAKDAKDCDLYSSIKESP